MMGTCKVVTIEIVKDPLGPNDLARLFSKATEKDITGRHVFPVFYQKYVSCFHQRLCKVCQPEL